ncbi:unnamed protein product, partial [Urochloa humidicola]
KRNTLLTSDVVQLDRMHLHPPNRYRNNASEIHPQIYEFHLNNTTAAYPTSEASEESKNNIIP